MKTAGALSDGITAGGNNASSKSPSTPRSPISAASGGGSPAPGGRSSLGSRTSILSSRVDSLQGFPSDIDVTAVGATGHEGWVLDCGVSLSATHNNDITRFINSRDWTMKETENGPVVESTAVLTRTSITELGFGEHEIVLMVNGINIPEQFKLANSRNEKKRKLALSVDAIVAQAQLPMIVVCRPLTKVNPPKPFVEDPQGKFPVPNPDFLNDGVEDKQDPNNRVRMVERIRKSTNECADQMANRYSPNLKMASGVLKSSLAPNEEIVAEMEAIAYQIRASSEPPDADKILVGNVFVFILRRGQPGNAGYGHRLVMYTTVDCSTYTADETLRTNDNPKVEGVDSGSCCPILCGDEPPDLLKFPSFSGRNNMGMYTYERKMGFQASFYDLEKQLVDVNCMGESAVRTVLTLNSNKYQVGVEELQKHSYWSSCCFCCRTNLETSSERPVAVKPLETSTHSEFLYHKEGTHTKNLDEIVRLKDPEQDTSNMNEFQKLNRECQVRDVVKLKFLDIWSDDTGTSIDLYLDPDAQLLESVRFTTVLHSTLCDGLAKRKRDMDTKFNVGSFISEVAQDTVEAGPFAALSAGAARAVNVFAPTHKTQAKKSWIGNICLIWITCGCFGIIAVAIYFIYSVLRNVF